MGHLHACLTRGVGCPAATLQPPGNFLKDLVPGGRSHRVVKNLEAVQIQNQHCVAESWIALPFRKTALQPIEE
jgi:hypothetical protein